MEKVDITVIGAGVIGLAVAYKLAEEGRNVLVVEKNDSFGRETSSRNSEVIHGGLYYKKGSLKAESCIKGNRLLYDFCAKHGVPYRKTGKFIVAFDDEGIESIENIYKNAASCGVDNLRFVDEKELKGAEPLVRGKKAVFSPDTGIIDVHGFMSCLHRLSVEKGADYICSTEVTGIKRKDGLYEIKTREANGGEFSFLSAHVINCAGLESDRIAQAVGIDIEKNQYKIHLCKGQYFRLRNAHKFPLKHLVYPPPLSNALGIHVVLDLGGGIRLGPDARYVSEIDYNVNENDRAGFFGSVRRFLPDIRINDLEPDVSGIRPKLQVEGGPQRDFVIKEESSKGLPNFINLIGIESPGLTASLSIAEIVKGFVCG